MRFCDLTFAYTATSGGIRTYLDQKRKHLLERTAHEHVMIVPAEETAVERTGRAITYRVASPLIPGCEPYRFFARPGVLLDTLRAAAPDVIELGSFFVEPWTAFRYRDEVVAAGRRCLVGGYFHTDLADAYVGSPVRKALGGNLPHWSELAVNFGSRLGDLMEAGATSYFGSLFKRCDVMCAASEKQVRRLAGYGVSAAKLVPLAVDLERFHPRRRSAELRTRYGAGEGRTLLVYAGRLDREKRVHVLLDAFAQLRLPGAVLVLVGEGPARAELEARAVNLAGVHVLPYIGDPEALADLLASAEIYVTAGPHETFGLSVVEAQASGLPVVGVRSGALVDRVDDACGRLGPVDDAEAMARNIEDVAAHAAAMSAAARQRAESGYGWEQTFGTLLDIYETRWHPTPPLTAG